MNTEITKLTIRIAGSEVTVTVDEARRLRDALNDMFGAPPTVIVKERDAVPVPCYPACSWIWPYQQPKYEHDWGKTWCVAGDAQAFLSVK